MANNPAGTKLGAASTPPGFSLEVVLLKGAGQKNNVSYNGADLAGIVEGGIGPVAFLAADSL
jgi:hypothetical protein